MVVAAFEPTLLGQDQVHEAGQVLGRAFHTNPIVLWTMPDEARRRRSLPWSMSRFASIGCQAGGEVYTTPGRVDGCAIWLPPGRTTVGLRQLARNGLLLAPLRIGVSGTRRFLSTTSRFEALHKSAMPAQHWYLFVLGVDPPLQGQGIGSKLLQPVLRKADADGLDCYLETDKDIDVLFYRKHGFEVAVEGVLPRGGPPFWTMKRPPRV